MPSRKKVSISRVLALSLTLTVVAVSVVTVSVSYIIISQKAEVQLEEKADEYISSLALVLEIPVWDLDYQNIKRIGKAYIYNEFVEKFKIIDNMGNVYLDYNRASNAPTVHRSSQILHDGQSIGLVEISLTAKPYYETNRHLLLSAMSILLAIVLVLLLVTRIFSSMLLNRLLDKLGGIVNAYFSGKYDAI